MLHQLHAHVARVRVAQHVGDGLTRDRRKAARHGSRCLPRLHAHRGRERRPLAGTLHDRAHLYREVAGIVAQVVHARAHLVERLAHSERHGGEVLLGRLAAVHHAVRLGLHHGAREQVAHVVMDVSRDAGPLGERGQTHLIVLRVEELAVLLGKGELGGAQLVAGAQGVAVATLKDAGTKPEPRAHHGPKNGEKDDRALGANAPAKRKGDGHGGGRKPCATSFERRDEAEVTGSDAEQRRGARQRAREGAAQKRRHEAHRPAQDLDERGRRHGRKQRDHDRRAHRPARGGSERGQAGDERHDLVDESLHKGDSSRAAGRSPTRRPPHDGARGRRRARRRRLPRQRAPRFPQTCSPRREGQA